VTVLIGEARHSVDSPRAAALIDFIVKNQDELAHDSGSWKINYKGDSLTIEPSFAEQLKIDATSR
jgi:hypothetical protein